MTGLPLDEHPMPEWCNEFLTAGQLSNNSRLRWVTLLDQAPVTAAEHHVAMRLYVHTVGGKSGARAWPSITKLARRVKLQRPTVRAALARLIESGWIVQFADQITGKRVWHLSWPTSPQSMLAPERDRMDRCLAITKAGAECMRPLNCSTHRREDVASAGQPLTTPGQPLITAPGQPLTARWTTTAHEVVTEDVTSEDVIEDTSVAPLSRRSDDGRYR